MFVTARPQYSKPVPDIQVQYRKAVRDLTEATSGTAIRHSSSLLRLAKQVRDCETALGFNSDAPRESWQPRPVDYVVPLLTSKVSDSLKSFDPQDLSLKSVAGGVDIQFTLEDARTFAREFSQDLSGKLKVKISFNTDETKCRITFGDSLALDYFEQRFYSSRRSEVQEGSVRVVPKDSALLKTLKRVLGF